MSAATPFVAEQFTATKWASAEEKARWANAMRSWIQRGFPEKGWRKGLYEHLHNMYCHIAHTNMHGFSHELRNEVGKNPMKQPGEPGHEVKLACVSQDDLIHEGGELGQDAFIE